VIPLPVGYAPEGIATGRGTSFYAGSLADGSVYGGDLRTGEGNIVVPPQEGRIAVGMKVDQRTNALFVAGGFAGEAYIYDAATGAEAAAIPLAPPGQSFINDVVVTRDAAYFTDSFNAVLYRVPLAAGGALPQPPVVETIPLIGQWLQAPGSFVFNANGIEAVANGKVLIIVNSTVGKLYRVNPATGYAEEINLGGESVSAGDGILLDGKTLYVVRNQINQIAAIDMANDFASGTIAKTITNPNFNVPTTIAEFGKSLYAVNAKFGTPPAGTPYEVVKVGK
jgi:hypothetical protein